MQGIFLVSTQICWQFTWGAVQHGFPLVSLAVLLFYPPKQSICSWLHVPVRSSTKVFVLSSSAGEGPALLQLQLPPLFSPPVVPSG